MRRGIVAGNWKMHGDAAFARRYVAELAARKAQARSASPGLLVFPPVGYVSLLVDLLAENDLAPDAERPGVEVGAQNLHASVDGPFTGEMSGEMLRDLGATWVIVGHSERRAAAGESDDVVAAKVAAALRAGLRPVVCLGETEAEREAGAAESVVARQLTAVVEEVGAADLGGLTMAYEPVWAIGTGRTATPEIAQEMHGCLRGLLEKAAGEAAEKIPLLYGGSVKPENAQALFAQPDIDGALVGGASLEAAGLLGIARAWPE